MHVGMSLWYVARLTTYLDHAFALRFEDPVQLQVKSYIIKKQFSKSQHLASYVSHHNAMAYVKMGIVWKPDLQDLSFLLGHHNICLRDIRDGRLVAQLPFLVLRIFQPFGSLEGSTHFGVLPESGTEHEFFERRLWQDL
jgi:hypothetical protein